MWREKTTERFEAVFSSLLMPYVEKWVSGNVVKIKKLGYSLPSSGSLPAQKGIEERLSVAGGDWT